jgi:hypothetical protein
MRNPWRVAVLLMGAVAPLCGVPPAKAQTAVPANVPEIAFDSVPNFLKLPPSLYLGEVAGIAVNSRRHVFVLSRGNSTGPAYGAAAAQLLEFDPQGKYLREIGHNLYAWSYAHSVRIDSHDDIWVADKGSDVVVRFDPAGRVDRVFGRKAEAADESAHPLAHPNPPLPAVDGLFRQVTDITWDSDDNVYISDGYINSRIARYDRDGNWIGSWGEPGSGPGQFNTPHSIVADRQNHIYVADRGNRRIQVFNTSGALLNTIHIDVPAPVNAPVLIGNRPTEAPGSGSAAGATMQPGAPWALCITPGATQYLFVSDAYPGRIYKLALDGTVLGWLGGAGRTPKKFGWIHALSCPSEQEIYVAELLNWRVQKLLLHY